jgi:hypothetical protein
MRRRFPRSRRAGHIASLSSSPRKCRSVRRTSPSLRLRNRRPHSTWVRKRRRYKRLAVRDSPPIGGMRRTRTQSSIGAATHPWPCSPHRLRTRRNALAGGHRRRHSRTCCPRRTGHIFRRCSCHCRTARTTLGTSRERRSCPGSRPCRCRHRLRSRNARKLRDHKWGSSTPRSPRWFGTERSRVSRRSAAPPLGRGSDSLRWCTLQFRRCRPCSARAGCRRRNRYRARRRQPDAQMSFFPR